MNLRDLQYLVALADHGAFHKAAEVCFVSQPALSMQIKKLEESLGVKLLERHHKKLMLTESGLQIVNEARQILTQFAELRSIAQAAKDPYQGELKIGIFPTLAPYLLPLIIPTLTKAYPKLTFYLIEEPTAVLIEKLQQGKIHTALLALPIVEKNFISTPLFEEEFLVAVSHQHPLAQKKLIQSKDLMQQNLLLLTEGHCLRDQALAICQTMHTTETPGFQATSLETLRYMIMANVGMTLMPRLACHAHPTIRYIPFARTNPKRTIGLIWKKNSSKSTLLIHLAEKIKLLMNKSTLVKVCHAIK